MNPAVRRRLVRAAAPVAGLLAAGLLVWHGSNAAFTADTTNTGDAWSTGKLVLQNNGGGTTYADTTAALFSETGIKPGIGGAKCITVESTGTLPSSLRFFRGAVTGTGAVNLAAAVVFTVDATPISATTNVAANCSNWSGSTTGGLYTGSVTGVPTTYAGSSATVALSGGTERVAYRIGWLLPSAVTDNTLQGVTATLDLAWEAQ